MTEPSKGLFDRRQGLLSGALILMAAAAFIKLLSLVRDVLVAALYGADARTDSFYVAMAVCMVLSQGVGGALGMSFVPLHGEVSAKGPDEERRFTHAFFQAGLLLALATGAIVALLAEPIVRLVAPGLADDDLGRTVAALRILSLWLGSQILHLLLNGVFEARRTFLVTAIFGALNMALVVLLVLVTAGMAFSQPLAWAWAGGMTLMMIAFAAVFLIRTRYRPTSFGALRGISATVRFALPLTAVGTLLNLPPLLDRWWASGLPEGSSSAVAYAFFLFNVPVYFLVEPLSRATLPFLSDLAREPGRAGLAEALRRVTPLACLLVAPLSAFSALESESLVRLVFERRAFDARDSEMTSVAFSSLVPGMMALALTTIFAQVFTAMRRSKSLMAALAAGVGVKVALSSALVGTWGVLGLGVATACGYAASLLALGIALRAALGGAAGRTEWAPLLHSVAATALALGAVSALRSVAVPGGVVTRGILFLGIYLGLLMSLPGARANLVRLVRRPAAPPGPVERPVA